MVKILESAGNSEKVITTESGNRYIPNDQAGKALARNIYRALLGMGVKLTINGDFRSTAEIASEDPEIFEPNVSLSFGKEPEETIDVYAYTFYYFEDTDEPAEVPSVESPYAKKLSREAIQKITEIAESYGFVWKG